MATPAIVPENPWTRRVLQYHGKCPEPPLLPSTSTEVVAASAEKTKPETSNGLGRSQPLLASTSFAAGANRSSLGTDPEAKRASEEPDALIGHVRICVGPGEKSPGLLDRLFYPIHGIICDL